MELEAAGGPPVPPNIAMSNSTSAIVSLHPKKIQATILDPKFFIDEAFVGKLCQQRSNKIALPINNNEILNTLTLAYAIERRPSIDKAFLSETEEHVR